MVNIKDKLHQTENKFPNEFITYFENKFHFLNNMITKPPNNALIIPVTPIQLGILCKIVISSNNCTGT